jgi:hypothetical protein
MIYLRNKDMNKDDDLIAKAAALAPKPKRKKKQTLPLGGELPDLAGAPPPDQLPASAAKNKGGRPKKSENPETDEKFHEQLQGSLHKLSKKALRKLNTLLDDPNARVQMQAALGTIRSTVQALTRDTSTPGGGAEIHIHTSQAVAVVNPCSPGSAGAAPNPHDKMQRPKGIGHPIAIVK